MSLLDTASLIVTPNAYKEGKLYSVIPSDGSGDLSVTRATTATRVNSAGLVELVPYNLVRYSEQFDNAAWNSVIGGGGFAPVRTANAAIAPNGTLTADQIVFNRGTGVTASSISGLNQSTSPISETCTGSIWIKAATIGDVGKQIAIRHRSTAYVVYTLTNEWVRVSSTQTGANLTFDIVNRATFTADEIVSVLLWGAQLVEGTEAKDYFATETRLNISRLDYSLGGCPSILVEPQRTNLLQRSEEFDNAYWTKDTATISANATTAPNGTLTADKLIGNNGSTFSAVNRSNSVTASTLYTLSVYVKAAEVTWFELVATGATIASPARLWVNASTGVLGTNNGGFSSATITNTGNGWFRVTATYTTTSTSSVVYFVNASADNVNAYSGNGVNGIFLWGAQLEAGAYPTSYIPTTSASVTRNYDQFIKTGISSLIGQTEGTLFLDVNFNGIESNVTTAIDSLMLLDDGTTNNIIGIALDTPSSNPKTLFGFVRIGGAFQALIYDSVIATNTRYKIALAYKFNDIAFYINGQLIGTDTSVSIPATSNIRLTQRSDSSWANECRTLYNSTAIFETRLTNAELATLTAI